MKKTEIIPRLVIEVFKTNIENESTALLIISNLKKLFPSHRFTIDLHDCDNVLRVEGSGVDPEEIMKVVRELGFVCSPLI